jgi:site-specific DNA-cytosine methylase
MGAPHVFTALHLFAGLGGLARGAADAVARLGPDTAQFKDLGGIDFDEEACADYRTLTGAPALRADLSTLTPAELLGWLRMEHGPEFADRRPDAVVLSAPCKGFSGLLPKKAAESAKYQAMNQLLFQGLFLVLSTWDAPPPLIAVENVPRIATRGAEVLAKVRQLLHAHGYVFHEGTHDCGEIGGLAQHRRRFLMVARHVRQVPAFVHRPPKHRVRGCGEVLTTLPLPEHPDAGRLHQLPEISWLNWLRLALIPAGGDWRDLPTAAGVASRPNRFTNQYRMRGWEEAAGTVTGDTDIQEGAQSIADPRVAQALALGRTADGASTYAGRPGLFGVNAWAEPIPTVTGKASISSSNAVAAVADPRVALAHRPRPGSYGVTAWEQPSPTVRGVAKAQNGGACVADPRLPSFGNVNRVRRWDQPVGTITHAPAPSSGAAAVADPRLPPELVCPVPDGKQRRSVFARYDLRGWTDPARTVAGPGVNGGFGVADPRVELACEPRAGTYGVVGWEEAIGTVVGNARIDNGRFAVADPREAPEVVPVIVAADGTWHRPLTTLELAALQDLPTTIKGRPLALAGRSNTRWRERIGNAVPGGAGKAIATSLLAALLASKLGTWTLSMDGIWVRQRDGYAQEELSA